MLSWKVLALVWSSYYVENPLAPVSEERNSTMDATLGALKHVRRQFVGLSISDKDPQ